MQKVLRLRWAFNSLRTIFFRDLKCLHWFETCAYFFSSVILGPVFSSIKKGKYDWSDVWLFFCNGWWPGFKSLCVAFKILKHYSVKTGFRETTRGENSVAKQICKTFSSDLVSSIFNVFLSTSALVALPGVTKVKYFAARIRVVKGISVDSQFLILTNIGPCFTRNE